MGDDDERLAVAFVAELEELDDFFAVLAVQAAGGFVGEHDGGGVHQGTADGDALLLTAGELVGQMGTPFGKAEEVQEFFEAFFVDASFVHEDGQGDVFDDVEGGDEVVELVDQSDLSAAKDGKFFIALGVNVLTV